MAFLLEKIAERQAELADLPQNVKHWMTFMRILFFSGILFVIWWKPARWIVLTMVLTAIGILTSKITLPNFDTILAGTIFQLIFWIPLLVYLGRVGVPLSMQQVSQGNLAFKGFALWTLVCTAVIAISTAFNLWNIIKLIN